MRGNKSFNLITSGTILFIFGFYNFIKTKLSPNEILGQVLMVLSKNTQLVLSTST